MLVCGTNGLRRVATENCSCPRPRKNSPFYPTRHACEKMYQAHGCAKVKLHTWAWERGYHGTVKSVAHSCRNPSTSSGVNSFPRWSVTLKRFPTSSPPRYTSTAGRPFSICGRKRTHGESCVRTTKKGIFISNWKSRRGSMQLHVCCA